MDTLDVSSKRGRDELPTDYAQLAQPPPKSFRQHPPGPTATTTTPSSATNTLPIHHTHQHGLSSSPAHDVSPSARPVPTHLQINYLARRYADDLALVSPDDSLTHALYLLNSYSEAMERSESLASNLGAKPLGTILVKRFERLFDGAPRIVHAGRTSRRSTTVTWLDVAQFAASNSDQYDIMHLHDGKRVCQFAVKGCTVQINEEDWLMIKSGLPQNIIPPQPIAEDEEKELGALEILEESVGDISHLADQIAARARQFNHRLKARKQAIIERRMAETAISGAAAMRASSPSNVAFANGDAPHSPLSQQISSAHAARDGEPDTTTATPSGPAAVSQTVRDELLKSFAATRHGSSTPARRPAQTSASVSVSVSQARPLGPNAYDQSVDPALSGYSPTRPPGNPVPRNLQQDDGGPFKPTMVLRLELLGKHERIVPPCDRCRRLKIDCLKNLSACVGCTKKHAKCSWKDVTEEEMIQSDPHYHRGAYAGAPGIYALSTGAGPNQPGAGEQGPGQAAHTLAWQARLGSQESPSTQRSEQDGVAYGSPQVQDGQPRAPSQPHDSVGLYAHTDSAIATAPDHESDVGPASRQHVQPEQDAYGHGAAAEGLGRQRLYDQRGSGPAVVDPSLHAASAAAAAAAAVAESGPANLRGPGRTQGTLEEGAGQSAERAFRRQSTSGDDAKRSAVTT